MPRSRKKKHGSDNAGAQTPQKNTEVELEQFGSETPEVTPKKDQALETATNFAAVQGQTEDDKPVAPNSSSAPIEPTEVPVEAVKHEKILVNSVESHMQTAPETPEGGVAKVVEPVAPVESQQQDDELAAPIENGVSPSVSQDNSEEEDEEVDWDSDEESEADELTDEKSEERDLSSDKGFQEAHERLGLEAIRAKLVDQVELKMAENTIAEHAKEVKDLNELANAYEEVVQRINKNIKRHYADAQDKRLQKQRESIDYSLDEASYWFNIRPLSVRPLFDSLYAQVSQINDEDLSKDYKNQVQTLDTIIYDEQSDAKAIQAAITAFETYVNTSIKPKEPTIAGYIGKVVAVIAITLAVAMVAAAVGTFIAAGAPLTLPALGAAFTAFAFGLITGAKVSLFIAGAAAGTAAIAGAASALGLFSGKPAVERGAAAATKSAIADLKAEFPAPEVEDSTPEVEDLAPQQGAGL